MQSTSPVDATPFKGASATVTGKSNMETNKVCSPAELNFLNDRLKMVHVVLQA